MSQENVETFKRAAEAINRRDTEAFLDELDPDVEWHPGLLISSGADIESPYGYVVDFRGGAATRIRSYLDPEETLEAAGLQE